MLVRWRLSWRLVLLLFGLLLGAYLLRHLLVPDPTVLAVTVVDAISGRALSGAHIWVQAPGGPPLPTATTDPTGQAHFLNLPSGSGVGLRVQIAEYDLLAESQISVAPGRQTNLTLPLTPHAGGRLLVGLADARIVEIDTASLLPLDTVVLPAAEGGPVSHLLFHPEEDWLYAVAGSEGFLLDSQTGATLTQLEIEPPQGLNGLIQTWGFSRDGQRLLALDFVGEHLLTLEASSGRLLASSSLCRVRITEGEVQLLPKPQGAHLRVARFARGAMTIVPLEALVEQSPQCLPVMYDPRAILSRDGRYLYTWLGPGYVRGVDRLREELRIHSIEIASTRWVTRSLPAGISALATSPSREEIYVLNDALNTLDILAPLGEARQLLVPLGKGPEVLVVGAGGMRAFVANRQSETVSVVDLASARVVHTIPLPGQPHSLALQEATYPR